MNYQDGPKRWLDIALSSFALVLLSPVMVVTGLLIRIEDGKPVLYRQTRPGRNGAPFTILKFRSMPTDTATAPSDAMGGARLTRVGRVIRRLNVDELPQLFNILRGDMSIVGPRPPLPSQHDLIELRRQGGALHLRPGLTGLAQVNAFDGMTALEKARFDNEYAQAPTFGRDVRIVLKTISYLFKPPPTY